jgi:fructokinase
MTSTSLPRPVIFGEVLFDSFPDGHDVLGGAPFNVAWHLQGLGLAPLMITRVGDDPRGREVLQAMQAWGMDTSGVQIDASRPTGVVAVTLQAGQPQYDIVPRQAYDYIEATAALEAMRNMDVALIYHGSLATRGDASRQALERLLTAAQLPVFLDVNLRAPWWTREQVTTQIQRATWVKLNDEELAQLTDSGDIHDLPALAERFFLAQPQLRQLIVTRGAAGALVVNAQGVDEGAPISVDKLVDTVGAGDAFAATMIAGIIRQWPLTETLAKALRFAARICQQRGATKADQALYAKAFPTTSQ